jgi:hypothetical protein
MDERAKKRSKTINSRYSLVVTHPTTNRPAHGLSTAERTGSPVFHVLWSIATALELSCNMYKNMPQKSFKDQTICSTNGRPPIFSRYNPPQWHKI